MLLTRFYYSAKPWLPWRLRMGIRRLIARRKRTLFADVWPIKESAGCTPKGWPGWPEGKQFAFVLTHDVESQVGLDRVRPLAELEMELGFRSSFNFIPEGEYLVPKELRHWLMDHGFEVGVHDLYHDGKLYRSRETFSKTASKINSYLKEWDAVGFRSGFMLHRLDWLHELDIQYDTSTFDSDPFEPQPDGVNTIFPFWVPRFRKLEVRNQKSDPPSPLDIRHPILADGYVELPYTLPQDSTLFFVLDETSPDIWKKKLDWIVEHGGMGLINVHPDYISFGASVIGFLEFSHTHYRNFLEYVRKKYANRFWHSLPREMAAWYVKSNLGKVHTPRSLTLVSKPPNLRGKRAAVLLYSYYPADPRPRRAAEALFDAGIDVDLLCLSETESEAPQERVAGVQVFRLPMQRRRESKWTYFWQYGRFLVSSFWFLAHRGLRQRYDLVHVHNMPDVLVFTAVIPKLLGAAVILDLHDPMPELMMSIYRMKSNHWFIRLLCRLERWSIAFAEIALTPNVTFRNLFVSRSCCPEKMHIVMNSPQEEVFNPDRAAGSRPHSGNGEFRIMHHGSIVCRHGIDFLVEAIAQVRRRIPGVRLDIYGARTSFLDTVLEVARRLGVADIVHYHGAVSQTEIARAIQEADLGVVPNRRSAFTDLNFPTRIFEYLSMRRPVIAPATQGVKDYFSSSQLLMFEPGNLDDLVERILWVREQPEAVRGLLEESVQVYRQHLWSEEKARFMNLVGGLFEG